MIVRRFIIDITIHGIGNTVITNIYKNKEIFSTDGLGNDSLAFTGTEAATGGIYNKIIGHISLKSRIVFDNVFDVPSEMNQVIVDALAKLYGRV